MKLLIIGGTTFIGQHMTETALARGHEVTLFNRGQTNPHLFPNVEKLHGDRSSDDDLQRAFNGRTWDAVIDNSGYIPRHVRMSAKLLADKVEHYAFTSTISVYSSSKIPQMDESGPLHILPDPTVEDISGGNYGGLKVLCEQAVEAAMPGRAIHIRAGMIVGPRDYMNRFPYWVRRIAEGGEVLAPGNPDAPVQVIDARDQAEWTVDMCEQRVSGVFNATGPAYRLTMRDLLETCRTAANSDATFTWASDEFLLANEVAPVDGLPYWLPNTDEFKDEQEIFNISCSKAIAAGLTFRPLLDTARDTLEWLRAGQSAHIAKRAVSIQSGISREREAELLQAWHESTEH
jgi:2'-hydroxyisoflavone reductase